jgi:hypothetical protein
MAGASVSDVYSFGAAKELYGDDREYQANIANTLYKYINKDGSKYKLDGNYFNVETVMQMNESYGAINDSQPLPQSGIPKSEFAKYRSKNHYATVEMTTKAATRGWAGGLVDGKYQDRLVKGTLLTFISNINFDLYGNGRGKRAVIATATATQSSFTVDSAARIRPGMTFDWYDSSLATLRGSIQVAVKGVDRMTRTVYIDSSYGTGEVPAGAAADDILVVKGALDAGEPTDGRHLAGLERITDNTVSLGEINPSNYAEWQSVNQNLAGGSITQAALQIQFDSMHDIAGYYPDRCAFNTAQKRSYLAQFLNQRRFTTNSFDTGAKELTFDALKMGVDEKNRKPGELIMIEDKDCDPDVWYFWCNEHLVLGEDYFTSPHMADEDGSDFRFRQGFDSLQGFYRYWTNTVVDKRNCTGKIYNLAIPSGVL